MIMVPQVKPAPKPSIRIVSPELIFPELIPSSSASGIDAADVLPCFCKVIITFSMGMLNLFATEWIILVFAW